ncbi:hypothetical protein ACQCP0_25915, partial [Ralstonia pseudosolanacearum]|uniref:hypothetical protein n=1 Tax=Ralstonia pseudosolanacearum TaxID=1310165 RepID=UPI001AEC34DE
LQRYRHVVARKRQHGLTTTLIYATTPHQIHSLPNPDRNDIRIRCISYKLCRLAGNLIIRKFVHNLISRILSEGSLNSL